MTRRSTFPPLVVLILSVIVATTSTPAAIVPAHGPSASGSGLFRFINPLTVRGEMWRFTFEAFANKNDHARGRAQFDNLTAQTQVVVRINCLRVDSGFAIMSGIVLHSDDPNLPKLAEVLFAASDAELATFPRFDSITPLFSFPGLGCQDAQPLTILPVQDGDIQIEP
ncbi:MAG TPA: hypothetical protein VFS90_12385 [Pyrinomonadaceae bacterium]|nr:hypothetical protein [Pyrinomonadaceae bacterium]